MNKKTISSLALGILLIGLFSTNISQAQYTNAYWDVNGTTNGQGGTGTFSSSGVFWTTNGTNATANTGGPSGGALFALVNTNAGVAANGSGGYNINFGGTAGTVTWGGTYQAAGVNLLSTGYIWNIDGTGANNRSINTTNAVNLGANSLTLANGARGLNTFTFSGPTAATAQGITGTVGSTLTLRNLVADTSTNSFGVYLSGGTISSNIAINVDIGTGSKIAFGSQSSQGVTINSAITLNTNASGVALNITNSSSGTVAMNGVISGSSGLVLDNTSSGKIQLAASNNYSGGTTLNNTGTGLITISNAAAFGTGTITSAGSGVVNYVRAEASGFNITNNVQIDSGSTLRLNANNSGWNITSSGVIAGAGSMMFSNSGVNYYLTGTNNSFGGGVSVGNGTLYFTKAGTAGQNSSLGTNGTITIGGPSATTPGGLRWTGTTGIKTDETSDKSIVVAGTTGGLNLYADGFTNSSLTINGNINSTGTGAKTLTFAGYNTNTLTLNGVINENGGANSVVIGGTSSGTVVLANANNSFSGAITITNSTSGQSTVLSVANIGNAIAVSALGKNGTINFGNSSAGALTTLKYTGTGETSDKVINLASAVGGAILDQSGTGNLKFTSAIGATAVGAKTITLQGSTAGTGELGGDISDLGNVATLVKSGTGTWKLSGSNSYSGTTEIKSAGGLQLGSTNSLSRNTSLIGAASGANTGTLDLTAGGDYIANSYGVSTAGGNNLNFTNSSGSAATLRFTNANNYITLATSTSAGRSLFNQSSLLDVRFDGNIEIGSTSNSVTEFGGSGNFRFDGAIVNSGTGVRGVTKSGDGTLTLNAASGYNGVTTLSLGTIALGANGTLGTNSVIMSAGTLAVGTSSSTIKDLTVNNGTITGTGTLNSANNFTFANTATSTVSANLAGAAAVTQTGSSRVVLSGSNSFSGGLNLNSAGSGVDVTRAEALGTGTITAGSTNSKLGLNTITSLTITNAVNTGSSNTATMAFTPGAVGNSMTVTGLISGSGLSKVSGGGDLYLNNSGNTYSGGTEVGTGRIYVGSDGALGATTGAVNFGTTTNSVLAITSNVSFNANRNFTMSAAGNTANIDTGANDVTINGVISPISGVTGGLLAKLGTGSLTLAGANTYSGATTISSGVLNIRNGAGLGATNAGTTVADLAALELQNGISVGAEALTLNGTGLSSGGALRNISGNNTYGGLLALGSASRINSDSGTLTLTNTGTVSGAFALTVGGAGDTVLNSILGTGTGTLTKDGTGKFTMGGANTFTGLTTVSGGTLAYGVANALSSGAVTVNGSGAVLDIATFSDTVGEVTLTTGSITGTSGVLTGTSFAMNGTGSASAILDGSDATLTKTGAGTTTTLSRTNTYTGATTVSQGTLLVDTEGSIASSSLATVNGGLLNVNGAAGSVKVNDGGSLGGSGSVGAVTLKSGSFLKPGNSPGLLTALSATWEAGSTYNWEIDQASGGTAGVNWDVFSVVGALDLSALSSTAQMNLVLNSLSSMDDFSATTQYSWVFAQAGSLVGTAFTAGANVTDLFNINATAFNSGTGPANGWRVEVGSTGTTLNLMAVPEPSTGSMLGLGFAGLVVTRLLRRKIS